MIIFLASCLFAAALPAADIPPTGKRIQLFDGASVIQCCYAASCTRLSSTMTKIAAWANIDLTFSHASKTILDEKISLNVNRRLVRPAWMAGVLTSMLPSPDTRKLGLRIIFCRGHLWVHSRYGPVTESVPNVVEGFGAAA